MNALLRLTSAVFTLACLSISPYVSALESPQSTAVKNRVITLSAGGRSIKAEVAADDATRQQGLMFRPSMGKNDGMLFVFPELGYHAMWMRNTLIPLSVAYMDEAGKILSIHEMQPQTETPHQAAGPARYALEMNAAWFTTHKVRVGDVIKGLGKAPRPK